MTWAEPRASRAALIERRIVGPLGRGERRLEHRDVGHFDQPGARPGVGGGELGRGARGLPAGATWWARASICSSSANSMSRSKIAGNRVAIDTASASTAAWVPGSPAAAARSAAATT